MTHEALNKSSANFSHFHILHVLWCLIWHTKCTSLLFLNHYIERSLAAPSDLIVVFDFDTWVMGAHSYDVCSGWGEGVSKKQKKGTRLHELCK